MIDKKLLNKEDIGKEYFSFYIEFSRGKRLFNANSGIVQVKLEKVSDIGLKNGELSPTFSLVKQFGKSKVDVISKLNHYYVRPRYVYETYEEALMAYDNVLLEVIEKSDLTSANFNNAVSKLLIKKSERELSRIWYNTLSPQEKKYVGVLKEDQYI